MCRKIYNETALANILKNYLWQNELVSFPCTPVPHILTAHKMVDGHIWNWEIDYVTGYFTFIIIYTQ